MNRFLKSHILLRRIPRSFSWKCSLPVLSLLFFALSVTGATEVQAGMFICRDRFGSMQFTNVPTSSSCRPYSLNKNRWSVTSSHYGQVSKADYDQHISRIGRRYHIDPSLIKAIIHTESDFDHRAVSKKGALGLMQLMPETARELSVRNPFDPLENIDGGTRYLRKLLDNFQNNLILSLAAYNAGPGLVERTGGVPPIDETRRYINKVLKRYKTYKATFFQ
jgi:soluble lytic murein transglycosylase-like protein